MPIFFYLECVSVILGRVLTSMQAIEGIGVYDS